MNEEYLHNFTTQAFDLLFWNEMELVLYKDGSNDTRQIGCKSINEDEIIFTLDLSENYWSDSYVVYDYLSNDGQLLPDLSMREDFDRDIYDMIVESLANQGIDIID